MEQEIKQLVDAVFSKKPFDEEIADILDKCGFINPKSAFKTLSLIAAHINFERLFPDFFEKLICGLADSFEPERGLNNFERFSAKIFDKNYFYTILNSEPKFLSAIIALFSGSQWLTDILLNDPSIFDWLKEDETLNKDKTKDNLYRDLWEFLKQARSYNEKLKLLRQFKKREYIRIGLRDLTGKADVLETIKDISNLADVCLQNSYEFCEEELIKKHGAPTYIDENGEQKKAEFAVLGMGKLGGEELNFSSDIDLIYIYSSDDGKTKAEDGNRSITSLSNHEFFAKLARMLTDAINKVTSDGNVFRVDLGLRPEGQSGDIVSSIRSCEIYYESWGQTWERQALIKARVSAGSEELGKQFERIKQNFTYRKYLDFQAIDEIREGKIKIEKKNKNQGNEINVKLGKGGIRELEFIVQIFQLIHGGKNENIREKNTLKALSIICENNLLDKSDCNKLIKAYRFLRNIENKIQISFGLQTHSIPSKKEDQIVLARKMGISGNTKNDPATCLLEEYQLHSRNVYNIFNDLFQYKDNSSKNRVTSQKVEDNLPLIPSLQRRGNGVVNSNKSIPHRFENLQNGLEKDQNLILETTANPLPKDDDSGREANLKDSGEREVKFQQKEEVGSGLSILIEKYPFKNHPSVLKNLELIKQGGRFSHPTARSQTLINKLIPDILRKSSQQSDPDKAINNFEKFIDSLKGRDVFFDMLKENRKLIKLLVTLFGNSDFLSDILIRQPDLLDALLDAENIYRFKAKEKIDTELDRLLKDKKELIDIKNTLRKFKKGEELRIGLRFLLKESSLDNTFQDLSLLAEVYLNQSVRIAQNELSALYGNPTVRDKDGKIHECGFAVIGMGKFGGYELDFGSDLDVVFVYEGEGQTEGNKKKLIQNQEYFSNLSTMIYELASAITPAGYAYKIDAGLRPEGKKSVLALPISRFEKYFEERAQIWEKQSLTRARFIAGSEKLGKKFIKLAHYFAYEKRFEYSSPAEIHRLRMEMEKKLGKETDKIKDAKVGRGGLVDIEFIAQMLQLKFGGKFASLRNTRTRDVLKEAFRIGLLSPDYYDKLKESYYFLKQVINGLRIEHERSENKLPLSNEKLVKLAFRIGYKKESEKKNCGEFLKDYSRHTGQVRDIYNSFFEVREDAK